MLNAIWVFALLTFVLWLAMAERFIAGFQAANQVRDQMPVPVTPVAAVQPAARLAGETDFNYQARLNRRRA